MSQFLTQKEDLLKFLREREPVDPQAYDTVTAVCQRYAGLSRITALDLILDLAAEGLLERREGDWHPVLPEVP